MNNEFTSNKSMTDWEKLDSMTDDQIDFSDCPEITPEMAKNAKTSHNFGDLSGKTNLTLYLDNEIVTWYKKNETVHQIEINNLLKEYIQKTSFQNVDQ